MNNIPNLLNDKERHDYASLANCLGITLEELLQLDFHNENLFNESGLATKVKYVFNESRHTEILHRIKGAATTISSMICSSNVIISQVYLLFSYH